MLEPNDSEPNLDSTEDACKSDYFSDEGEVKNDVKSPENGTSGKRKSTDIGFDDTKKVKISQNETSIADKAAKSPDGITLNTDFKRAGSVASDNSDEFVDASDVLEPTPTVNKKPTPVDDVDTCAIKISPSSSIPKRISEAEPPKLKGNKFGSRLPTFADDPLDRFNSSAIRRGFFKEAEPAKPIDFNFDLNPRDKNDAKNESKIVRKVKLNRSKFFSTDKPKFSDDSSSDSNSKFNNSTSPVKSDPVSSIDTKVIQSVENENKIAPPSVEEKITPINEAPAVAPSVSEITQTEPKSSPEIEVPVIEDQKSSTNAESISIEKSSSSNEEKILDDVLQDQNIAEVEPIILDTPQANDADSQPSHILDPNIDDVKTDELAEKIDELMETSDIEQVSKSNDIIDEEIDEMPIVDSEPLPIQEIEPKSQLVSSESDSQIVESVEPELESELESQLVEPIEIESRLELESQIVESIEPELESAQFVESEPEFEESESQLVESVPEHESDSQLIESIPLESESELVESITLESESQLIESIEPEPAQAESEPVQSIESPTSSIAAPSEPMESSAVPVSQVNENEIFEEANDQLENLDEGLLSLADNSSKLATDESEMVEPEQTPFVSESDPIEESVLESDLVLEVPESDSMLVDEPLDTKEIISPDPEPVQDPAVSEIITESELHPEMKPQPQAESEVPAQAVDLDITTESEDLADDKTELDASYEESEGEIEEEEEEEIHEEELYLEDRMPPVSKPKDPTPPPEPVPSPPNQKEAKDVLLIDDEDDEKDTPSLNQSASSSPPLEQSIQASSPVQNIDNIPVEQPLESVPCSEDLENTPVEQPVREPSPAAESIENVFVERSVQRTLPVEDIENIPMDIDEEPEPVAAEPVPKELSKLEQALIGKPGIKRLEIQVPIEELPAPYEHLNERPTSTENDETKEKIKLHLSLQGDKVSIKKSPTIATPSGEVKAKRQYKKRNKDVNLKPDKTYKLRNRSSKKDEAAAQKKDQSKKSVAAAETDKLIELNVDANRIKERIYSAEPILIDSDDSSKSGPTKVQPIKLKISKNSNVTIECGPSYPEPDRNRESIEDTRKKDPIPNLMEQAATAWSGPDLQRVERLLKESNITITPVISKEPASSAPHSILKPMLVAGKEKPSTAPKFSTPSITSTVSQLQTATASITPISRDKYDSSSSEHTSPQRSDHQNGESDDHRRYRDGSETPTSSFDKQIDIKSEIRKMLASADKRKQDPRDSTDVESDSSDSKPKPKSIPDLVPINLPTPEMLQTLASSLGSNTSVEGDPLADKSKPELDPAFLPLLQTFPKRRGRPTKAMVAAREALKQSQEAALENLKQLATQKASEGQPLPIPILDINDPEELFKPKRGRKSRSERMDKSSDAEQSASETTADPEREAEEIKRLEEERIKKEEEKERRNEIRRQKARERNDLVKAKRLRQKMKAEERQKRMQEKRRKLQEEKKKLEEEIKNLPTSLPGFDDETRMSAENSQSQMVSFSTGMGDEDSSNATTEFSQRVKKSRMEVTDIDSKDLTVDQIAEYQWPIQGGELYMIQEQVSNYLGVKSFKRKYPDIKRRPVDSEEKAYLVDSGLVSETLCDLGLTAVSSSEVLDIMCADFADKYEELRRHMRDKQMKELSFKQKAWANGLGYKLLMADGTKQDLKKRAMESASNWNSALNKSRSDDRRCAIDLQTFIVHYPKTRTRKMTIPTPKMGSYPVSILPGQFCDFYKTYTSTELRYMPLNTVMYGPLKPHSTVPGDGSQTDSDDSSSSDESSTSSEGTQGTEDTIEDTDKDMSVDESTILDKSHDLSLLKEQMTMELSKNTRELIMDETAKILCKVCLGNITRNKENVPEVLIYCSQCSSTSHPTCLDLSLDMVPHIKKYSWQCPDCKICVHCKENADEDKMLFCDTCDRGYHIYCVGLKKVPSGRWQCQECTVVKNNCINNSTPLREVFKEPGLIDIQDG